MRTGILPNIPNLGADLGGEPDASQTDQTAIVVPKSVRSATRPALLVMSGGSAGQVFRLERDRTVIGRGREADVSIRDQGVSRLHLAILRERSGTCFVEDLESTNGTLVNGNKVDRAQLAQGDRIQVGPEVVLQFRFFDDAEEGLANTLYEAATRDPLTRAFNRRYFLERLGGEISYATRQSEKLVAVMLDIDHFKSINDSYGHPVGDEVLKGIANAIAMTLRNEDVFARFGGEEFVVVARGLSLRNGVKLAERLRKLIEEKVFTIERQRFRATISLGVAELAECRERAGDVLLRLADQRLYKAKQAGRNRVVAK